MSEESDQEISDLDIEARTWNKLQTTMKLFGFREGAVKGKDLSMQEGFNLGYLDGFKLGEYLGMGKGVINCEAELQLPSAKNSEVQKEELKKLSMQPCVVCEGGKNLTAYSNKEITFGTIENLISTQQSHNNKIINMLKNSNLESYR